uniref:Uncharacterized protein MANES_11G033700 n=1 Tax=Rhizophora mucronata TaxID=61149 RepID=A0A2P2QSX5_RHIMU
MEGVSGGKSNSKGHILKSRMVRIDDDNMLERHHQAGQFSGSEDDLSERFVFVPMPLKDNAKPVVGLVITDPSCRIVNL